MCTCNTETHRVLVQYLQERVELKVVPRDGRGRPLQALRACREAVRRVAASESERERESESARARARERERERTESD